MTIFISMLKKRSYIIIWINSPEHPHTPVQNTSHTCPEHLTHLSRTPHTPVQNTLTHLSRTLSHTCPEHSHTPVQNTSHTCPEHLTHLSRTLSHTFQANKRNQCDTKILGAYLLRKFGLQYDPHEVLAYGVIDDVMMM